MPGSPSREPALSSPCSWLREAASICAIAPVGVPKVTAHGQRGLHGTLAVEAGITARAVADALGHESFATTAQSYAKPEAVGRAKQRRALTVLNGGKSVLNTGSSRGSASPEKASA